jgi:hypothetical protein
MDGSLHAQVATGPCHSTPARDQHTISYQKSQTWRTRRRRTPLLSSPCSARTMFQKLSPIWFPACKRTQTERHPARLNVSFFVFYPKPKTPAFGALSYLAGLHARRRGADDDSSQHEDKRFAYSVGGHTCMLMISLGIAGKKRGEVNDVTSKAAETRAQASYSTYHPRVHEAF